MLDRNESAAVVKISWAMEWDGMRWKQEGWNLFHTMSSMRRATPLHFILWEKTPNNAMTPQRQSQFTPKKKANAVPRSPSSPAWIDQYDECHGMTSPTETMICTTMQFNFHSLDNLLLCNLSHTYLSEGSWHIYWIHWGYEYLFFLSIHRELCYKYQE